MSAQELLFALDREEIANLISNPNAPADTLSVADQIITYALRKARLSALSTVKAPAGVVAWEHFDNKGSKELSYHPATEYMTRIGYQSRPLTYLAILTPMRTDGEVREAAIRECIAECEGLPRKYNAEDVALTLRALLKEGERHDS